MLLRKKQLKFSVSVQVSDFNFNQELDSIKKLNKNFGGLASFLGQVRGTGDGNKALLSLCGNYYCSWPLPPPLWTPVMEKHRTANAHNCM